MVESISLVAPDGHMVAGSLLRAKENRGFALLVHGITADRHEWGFFDFLSEALLAKGINTLAIDYRGHGESTLPIEKLSLSGVFLDIMTAWQYIEQESKGQTIKRFVVGNSFGGGLAYLFGQMHKSVDTVIMTCPVTSYIADLNRVSIAWKDKMSSGFVPYASKQLAANTVSEMYTFDELIEQCLIRIPVEVIHGTADSDVPFGESSNFVTQRSENITLHPIDGMDHSFSAPEGATNQNELSTQYRQQAATRIATIIEKHI